MTKRINKINKIRRNKAINAFKELTKVLPVDIICNSLMYFNSPSLVNSEIGRLSVEYSIYNKYYNLLKTIASYKKIQVKAEDEIYILRRSVKGFGGCVESFSIKNTGDFILGIVKYGDLISQNNNDSVDTIDGDKVIAGPCGHLCLMSPKEYNIDICSSCPENPYCMLMNPFVYFN